MDLYGENMDILEPLINKGDVIIYQTDIDETIEDYISLLPNKDMILKPSCFHGLLEYIYKRYLKGIIKTDNGLYNDYNILNNIFYNIYVPLCYRFNISPTIISFCANMVHIDYSYIRDIKDGKKRNEYNIKQNIVNIIKGWYNISESTLLQKTIDSNSIGSIFVLKSMYQYSDNQPIQIEYKNTESHKSIDEIKEKYSNAFLPSDNELELSDNLNDDII